MKPRKLQAYIILLVLVSASIACTMSSQPDSPKTAAPGITLNDADGTPALSFPLAEADNATSPPTEMPLPVATETGTATPTATAAATATMMATPTPDNFAVVPHPENPDFVFYVDTQKWDILSRKPDYANPEFLIHRNISSCSIGLIVAMGCEFCNPPQPKIVYIGETNWEIQPFGGYVLLSHGIGMDIENDNFSEACRQDAYEVLASVRFSDGRKISEAPLPTYTPDVSRSGWYPCGEDYPISYLEPNTTAYVSIQDPRDQRIRAGAGTDQKIIGLVPPGTQLQILNDDPKCSNGWVWWRVQVNGDDMTGWTAEGDNGEQWIVSDDAFWLEEQIYNP